MTRHSPLPAIRKLAIAGFSALALLATAGCEEKTPTGSHSTTGSISSENAAPVPAGSGFDFYVLSLSWSPSWCAENDPGGDGAQCRRGSGHGFIVHGLWPQYERGYPEFCPSRQPERVPADLGRAYLDIIPSMGLIGHQWRKHGSCSGLGQKDYFQTVRRAYEGISIPDGLAQPRNPRRISAEAVEQAFIAANPGLSRQGIAVTCEAGRLTEVRICLTAGLSFRPCAEVDRAACRAKEIGQPPVQ